MKTLLLACAPLVLPAAAGASDPAQWNQFRGPGGRGVAAGEAEYPVELDLEKNLLWKVPVPAGHSSPCVWGDRVFVTGHAEDGFETLCIDRSMGKLLWKRTVPVEDVEDHHEVNGPASSTPAADAERVYASFGSFGLVAYRHDGEEAWRRELPTPENTFGSAASPILAEGRLILVRDSNDESFLEAIEPATGEALWRADRSGFRSGWSTPSVWRRAGRTELLVLSLIHI